MKALHYGALAKPGVAKALADQANATLGPVLLYLKQIIRTERERQRRYPMKWERVRDTQLIRIAPRDTLIDLQASPPGVRVTNWPVGRALPEKDPPPLIIVRSRSSDPIPVLRHVMTQDGPVLTLQSQPLLTDVVACFWDGVPCTLAQAGLPQVPQQLLDMAGRSWSVRRVSQGPRPLVWRLVLEGQVPGGLRLADPSWQATLVEAVQGLESLKDESGQQFSFEGKPELRLEALPDGDVLEGNNGIRFDWTQQDGRKRHHEGVWIQLTQDKSLDDESTIDPRAFFCEDGVEEVWTDTVRRDKDAYKVRDARRDQYRLCLDRLPPEGATLYLPTDRNIKLQRRAAFQLRDAPLPHHRGLLRLTEDPARARSELPGWGHVSWEQEPVPPARVETWRVLTDLGRSGTEEQRAFVQRALGTRDFAFLEGPPGSGKTTAICELALQLIGQGKTLLLCASTHFAIDNVLEKLMDVFPEVEAVRLGRTDRVDPRVRKCQLDERIKTLVEAWSHTPGLADRGDGELREMAERVVLGSANLTCATTMGIVSHPFLRSDGPGGERDERPHTRAAHFDVLIVDEASKTTLQEFLVPALLARKWIIVGDVRQLPPFTDRADLEINLRTPVDEQERPVFPEHHQRACLIKYRLLLREAYRTEVRWLIVDEPAVLDALQQEAALDPGLAADFLVRIVERRGPARGRQEGSEITWEELKQGGPQSLSLAMAQWVLVETGLFARVERYLPADLAPVRAGVDSPEAAFPRRHAHWLGRAHRLDNPFRDRGDSISHPKEAREHEQKFLKEGSWAREIAWRLTRAHELRRTRSSDEPAKLKREMEALLPRGGERALVQDHLDRIADISLPSVLESLQLGVRVENPRRRSYLLQGLGEAWSRRAVRLTYQHRMHAEISAFPRSAFYEDGFLKDEPPQETGDETVARRDQTHGWSFGARLPARRLWVDVDGEDQYGKNPQEVEAVRQVITRFLAWAERHPHAQADKGRQWEVACLSFYVRQEAALRDMLRKVTQQPKQVTRFKVTNAEIVCGTVDRFQGREADLVLLSLRNTRRVGFLDSPNRLNVALTRARRQLMVFGRRKYFSGCGVHELNRLADETHPLKPAVLAARLDE